jgi:hypothetical protein
MDKIKKTLKILNVVLGNINCIFILSIIVLFGALIAMPWVGVILSFKILFSSFMVIIFTSFASKVLTEVIKEYQDKLEISKQ